jgi:hypothetical protein
LFYLLGGLAAILLVTVLSAFLATDSHAAPFRLARQHVRAIWLVIVGGLAFASVPDLWSHGVHASDLSMFLAGTLTASVAFYLIGIHRLFDPHEWADYPPQPAPTGQIRGLLFIEPQFPGFVTVRGRRWLGLARRREVWHYTFAADCKIPDAIREAQKVCDEHQTSTGLEVDIEGEVGELGSFGPQGWCCREVEIRAITRIGFSSSWTPGPFLRKLWGLPPALPPE